MQDNELLINYIKNKQYSECISILKSKIASSVISKIKVIDNTVDFTTIPDLISMSDFYLNDSSIARKLQIAMQIEDPLEKIEFLLEICKKDNIK